MNKIVFAFVLSLCFSVPALAQNDFGNDEDLRSYTIYPGVPLIEHLKINYETAPIDCDPLTSKYVARVESVTAGFRPGESRYFVSTGTRLVIAENYPQPFRYQNRSVGTRTIRKVIFVVLPDTLSFIEILVDEKRYLVHYNRESKALGSMYDGRDTKTLGIDPDVDQKTLGQLLREYLPHAQHESMDGTKKKRSPLTN